MQLNRRSFLATALAPIALRAANNKLPVGLELYSVRGELRKDDIGTVREVAKMGYQVVEFFSPYYTWTPEHTKEMRKVLDDTGLRCFSTHNGINVFAKENLQKTIDYNHTLGVKYVVCASAGNPKSLDGWAKIADSLAGAMDTLRAANLSAGYHNHDVEFTPIEGKRPMEVIAAHTPKDFMLQLDVGPCVEMGSDPVAWIRQNPGRIRSLHVKDWSKTKGYKVLLGEGDVPMKEILTTAESTGGAEYFLIEQEGSDYSEFETAKKCLENFKKLRA